MEKQEADKQETNIEDLPVDEDAEVKGGPIYMEVEGIKGRVTPEGTSRNNKDGKYRTN